MGITRSQKHILALVKKFLQIYTSVTEKSPWLDHGHEALNTAVQKEWRKKKNLIEKVPEGCTRWHVILNQLAEPFIFCALILWHHIFQEIFMVRNMKSCLFASLGYKKAALGRGTTYRKEFARLLLNVVLTWKAFRSDEKCRWSAIAAVYFSLRKSECFFSARSLSCAFSSFWKKKK